MDETTYIQRTEILSIKKNKNFLRPVNPQQLEIFVSFFHILMGSASECICGTIKRDLYFTNRNVPHNFDGIKSLLSINSQYRHKAHKENSTLIKV